MSTLPRGYQLLISVVRAFHLLVGIFHIFVILGKILELTKSFRAWASEIFLLVLFLTLSTILLLFLTLARASNESGDLFFLFIFSSFSAATSEIGCTEVECLEDSTISRSLLVFGKPVKEEMEVVLMPK